MQNPISIEFLIIAATAKKINGVSRKIKSFVSSLTKNKVYSKFNSFNTKLTYIDLKTANFSSIKVWFSSRNPKSTPSFKFHSKKLSNQAKPKSSSNYPFYLKNQR